MSETGFWFEFVPDDTDPDFIEDLTWTPSLGANFEAVKARTFGKLDQVSRDPELVKSTWEEEVQRVASKCLPPTVKQEQRAQLVFGRVQAGKTSNFTGVISLLMDNGYELFIVVAGINLNLRDQTFDRLKKDLGVASSPGFEVHASDPRADVNGAANQIIERLKQISEPAGHFGQKFQKRLVYVVLKEITHLTWMNDVLKSLSTNHQHAQILASTSTLIIDDETDQASPDTYEKKDDQTGAIHEALATLRSRFATHTYAGYTATPYVNLLMPEFNRLKCTSISVLAAGPDYVGPEHLFSPENSNFATEMVDWDPSRKHIPKSLATAFATFIVQSAAMNSPVDLRKLVTEKPFSHNELDVVPCSMLIHASQRVNEAQKVFDELTKLKSSWQKALNSPPAPNGMRDKSYTDLWSNYLSPAFNEIFGVNDVVLERMRDIIETVAKLCIIRQINGPGKAQGFEFPSEEEFEKYPAWVLIGGQLLDRGQTLPHLVNTYMPRPPAGSKGNQIRGQFDTLQQRGRFYGQRSQYSSLLRGWFDGAALDTYKAIARLEPKNIAILKRHEESGLSLDKLHLIFELEGDLKLARSNVLPKDVFEMKSAKLLFRQTHFDSSEQSLQNIELLRSVLAGGAALREVPKSRNGERQNYEITLDTATAVDLLTNWQFSEREDKTRAVSIELLHTYFENNIKGVKLIMMSRRVDAPADTNSNGDYRSGRKETYQNVDGTSLETTKITGLTSSNDAKFISEDLPSIQVHFFELRVPDEENVESIGLALAFPNTTRVTGRKGTNA
jgi:hypothetical protein